LFILFLFLEGYAAPGPKPPRPVREKSAPTCGVLGHTARIFAAFGLNARAWQAAFAMPSSLACVWVLASVIYHSTCHSRRRTHGRYWNGE